MKLLICAVRDNKVDAFMQPFFARSRGEAMRSFMDAVGDKGHVFAKHPEDYYLYTLGTFDDETGEVTGTDTGVLMKALDCARQIEGDLNS